MAIIEIHGGPINHRYLMKKSKDELASMYMRLLRDTEQDAKDAERYRWLIENCSSNGGLGVEIFIGDDAPDATELAATIEAAMKGANAAVKPRSEAESA